MKKNKTKIIVSILLFVSISYFLLYHFCNDDNIKVTLVKSNHAILKTEELIQFADVIIIGKMINNYKECTPLVVKDDEGGIMDFYTKIKIQPLKVIKGNCDNDISINHRSLLIGNNLKISEDSELMLKGRKYLLFLKRENSQFSIIAENQGLYDIGGILNEFDSLKIDFKPDIQKDYNDKKIEFIKRYCE